MIPAIENLVHKTLDITAPSMLQVDWDMKRRVLYVHIEGVTVLRVCRITNCSFDGDVQQVKIPEAME